MKRNRSVIKYILACGAVLFMGMKGLTVQATEGSVTYGSDSYEWYTGQTCPIGIYISSETSIGSYEICLEYDETMLQYIEGATEQEGNRLYIRGTGSEKNYKIMLYFEPLQSGTTQLQVVSAAGVTAADVTAADVSGGVLQEPMQISQLPAAPIGIQRQISDRLRELSAEPTNIEGFSPDVYEYFLTVDSQVEELTLRYETEEAEAQVSVSDTALVIGENTITLSVKGSGAQARVYTLHVTRPEPLAEPEAPQLPDIQGFWQPAKAAEALRAVIFKNPAENQEETKLPGAQQEQDEQEEQEEKQTVRLYFRQNPVLWASFQIVLILTVAYLIFYLGKHNRKKGIKEIKEKEEAFEIVDLEQTVIAVKHVTMRFKMAQDEASSLKEYLIRVIRGKNQYHYLTVLNDINLEIKQGDVIGIIGTNGSGKSTLLKIISGALYPSAGHVEADRSKVQMLTLGTGFDMELTAKENVYLNGAIIGYSKEYINENYDSIVKFAELEGFMEERMKNFSSGMVSRLGFAIATMQDAPEILILDEVLSVGDLFFRQKSEKRIQELIHSGSTVLIVSHSLDTIQKNCNRVIWIEKGIMKMEGDPKTVCDSYRDFM